MASRSKRAGALLSACLLAGVSALVSTSAGAVEEPRHPASLDEAIIKSAARHGIPESLVRRIVMRESKYNPLARNHKYWGLMQISYPTAKSMGFKGTPEQLLNPVVNLRYAVPYLANAFIIAGKRQDAAVRLYAAGYYDTAKRRGLLGALRTADSTPLTGVPDEPDQIANLAPAPPPPEEAGIFGTLFGPRQMQREPLPRVASADPAQAGGVPQPVSAPTPSPAVATPLPPTRSAGKMDDSATDDVTLVADKNGNLQPPRKWLHDGGSTVIARGEQPIEKIAAFQGGATEKSTRGRHHKATLFAAIDAPPTTAQAYAGPQDQRLMQADSQAAITQATSGQPAQPGQPGAASDAPQQQALAEQQARPTSQALDASGYPADAGGHAADTAEAEPVKKKRHIAHRAHPHKTAIAQDDSKAQPATTQQ